MTGQGSDRGRRDQLVQSQYEAYPYPARNPADEKKRLIAGSPSNLAELNHYVFGGRRDLSKPLNALVAGGGTGDAAILLAQQMSDFGVPGEVVHLDQSEPSQKIAQQRAQVRGLDNLRFVRGSLLDVGEIAPGPWDYIDCCGVLHHLEDPAAGLAALADVLAPDGGLGVMVYGALGRIGVYHVQEMMHALAPPGDGDDQEPGRDRQAADRQSYRRPPGSTATARFATTWRAAMPASTICSCMRATAPIAYPRSQIWWRRRVCGWLPSSSRTATTRYC